MDFVLFWFPLIHVIFYIFISFFSFHFFVGCTECRLGAGIFRIFLHIIFKHFLRFFGSYFPAQHKSAFFPRIIKSAGENDLTGNIYKE